MTYFRDVDPLRISLDQPKDFDEAVNGPDSMPFGGDIRIITKDNGTESGRAIACLTWTTQLPDGTVKTAQAVTTMRLLKAALQILEARYDDDGRSRLGGASAGN